MPKDWDELTNDEILNFEEAHTGKMARYERVMQQRNIESTNLLKDKITGLTETIYRASQGLQDKYEAFSLSQAKQQNKIFWLTVVIALSTAVYTVITWQSVTAMNKSNNIQRQLLQIELNKQKEHNKSLNRNGAKIAFPD